MFHLFEIDRSRFLFGAEQDDSEVLVREAGLFQDLFLSLFF